MKAIAFTLPSSGRFTNLTPNRSKLANGDQIRLADPEVPEAGGGIAAVVTGEPGVDFGAAAMGGQASSRPRR